MARSGAEGNVNTDERFNTQAGVHVSLSFAFVACLLVSGPVAAIEECRFLESKTERQACYDNQEKARALKLKSEAPDGPKVDPIAQMKLDDDALSRRLRTICRGC